MIPRISDVKDEDIKKITEYQKSKEAKQFYRAISKQIEKQINHVVEKNHIDKALVPSIGFSLLLSQLFSYAEDIFIEEIKTKKELETLLNHITAAIAVMMLELNMKGDAKLTKIHEQN